MPRFSKDDKTVQQASPFAAVHRALERAKADVDKSERMPVERGDAAPARFQRSTRMRSDPAIPRLSEVFGRGAGKHRNGWRPALIVVSVAAIAAALYVTPAVVTSPGVPRLRTALLTGTPEEIETAYRDTHFLDRWTDRSGVLVAADAVLYRYHDAAPERLSRVLEAVQVAKPSPSYFLARILVSDIDRRSRELDSLLSAEQNQWILAETVRALEFVGEMRPAQKSLATLVRGTSGSAAAVVAAAQATDPRHAGRLWDTLAARGQDRGGWWLIATASFEPGFGADLPPVAAAEGHFARALQLLDDKKREPARRHLERMGQFVAYQPLFMLDFASRLVRAGQHSAARSVLDATEGELGAYADVLRGRMRIAKGDSAGGVGLLKRAWEAGDREPSLVADLLELGALAEPDEALRLWPHRIGNVLAKIRYLLRAERYEDASDHLNAAALWLVPRATDQQRAEFHTSFAESEFARGNVAGARNYVERALASSASYGPAKRLARRIKGGR